jgi:benzodiazapine receptor
MQRSVADWGGAVLAFALVIAANVAANAIPIGGQTTGEVSAKYESLFTPAGYTFSIWGLIYLGLLAYVIYQALPAQRGNAALAKISPYFVVSCIANCAWILAWHNDYLVLSLVLMLIILASLVKIYLLLGIGNGSMQGMQRLFVQLPFSIYTGWITVATIANISAVQSGMGWNATGLDPVNWTILKLAAAGAIGATVILRCGDIAFGLVVAWAALGIVARQFATAEVAGAAAAIAVAALLLAGAETARKLVPR